MAEPKLQIDQRLDRIEKAIVTLAQWLSAEKGAEEIARILQWEDKES